MDLPVAMDLVVALVCPVLTWVTSTAFVTGRTQGIGLLAKNH